MLKWLALIALCCIAGVFLGLGVALGMREGWAGAAAAALTFSLASFGGVIIFAREAV